MLNSNVLDIVIGLIFIYLILSLFASAINEIVMRWLYSRGKNLKRGIVKLLSDHDDESEVLVRKFFDNSIFKKFCSSENKLPSYLTDLRFVEVLLFALSDEQDKLSVASVRKNVQALPDGSTKRWLLNLINEADEDLNKLKEQLHSWYNDIMERATGWYKRKAHWFLFYIGLVISIMMNADTFQIVRTLNSDPDARAELVKMTELQLELLSNDPTLLKNNLDSLPEDQNNQRIDELEQRMDSLFTNQILQTQHTLGLGWEVPKDSTFQEAMSQIGTQVTLQGFFGWLITAVAISLGAPFWFDLLNKVVSIRGAGKKPTQKKSSKETVTKPST